MQELTLRQEAGDAAGEARAHSHLGAVHMALGHYSHAARCYRVKLFFQIICNIYLNAINLFNKFCEF